MRLLHGSVCKLVLAPVFKTGVTRLRQVWWVRFPHSPATFARAIAAALALCCAGIGSAAAQVTDTVVVPTVVPIGDTTPSVIVIPPRAPISPRAAFVRSLFLPGYGQAGLERSMSAGVFALTEVIAIGMTRKSQRDLREARRAPADSTVLTFQRDPATGALVLDPETGQPIPASFTISDMAGRVRARKTHLEDWIAVLLFNHLFAAADAYVAAHLWDFPARVNASVSPEREARVGASIAW
jgi:hypothetical protein